MKQAKAEPNEAFAGAYTTEFRMLDARLGRWFSPDPITHPWQSPYCSMDNNPIALTDVMGLDADKGPDVSCPSFSGGSGSGEASSGGTGFDPQSFAGVAAQATPITIAAYYQGNSSSFDRYGVGRISISSNTIGAENLSVDMLTWEKKMKKWGSMGPATIHQEANFHAVFRMKASITGTYKEESKKVEMMNKGTVYADGAQFQTGSYSYRHAMKNKGQTVEEAKKNADAFVRNQFKYAKKLLKSGLVDAAYYQFGIGLHTLQDATSPEHSGFQEWTGKEGKWQIIKPGLLNSPLLSVGCISVYLSVRVQPRNGPAKARASAGP